MDQPKFSDLSEILDLTKSPRLDRYLTPEEIEELSGDQLFWRDNGYLIKEGFLPDDLINRYCEVRETVKDPRGWPFACPYMLDDRIKDLGLYSPLMRKMEELIGEPMLMHLNLTGWVSTERNLHMDSFLSPEHVHNWYCAVWFALDDISEDSGPFEYFPGTHAWPLTTLRQTFKYLTEEEKKSDNWPKIAEKFMTPAIEEELLRQNVKGKKFIAKKGDVLFWHGNLIHRGTEPNVPGMIRKSFIAHYSGVNHRQDMPNRAAHTNGHLYLNQPVAQGPKHYAG